eukprot:Seg3131.4 transcript_id=Seg3131.4/GoldUCD/mRNA.D3Y31 product="hypothetical protein" protein_id=Seg3131.4/GoldUCD/D3Y31
METGLRDDNILTKFRPVLHIKNIPDEDLIQQMGNISSAEAERQARLGKRVKDVQASPVVSDGTNEERKEAIQQKKKAEKSSESRIFETIEAMQAQIQSLQEEVKKKSEAAKGKNYYRGKQNNPPGNGQEPFRACSECNEQGLSQSCTHCYYCHVGRKRTVNVKLEGKSLQGLWDTGAQVSILSLDTVKRYFPTKTIRKIEGLLEETEEIKLVAANGTPIPYEGWIELEMQLSSGSTDKKESIQVPFLVTKETLDLPIIGFNVICELTKDNFGLTNGVNTHTIDQLKQSFPILSNDQDCLSLIKVMKNSTDNDYICAVKTSKKDFLLPRRSITSIKARANTGYIAQLTPALLEPEVIGSLPYGLHVNQMLVTLKKGKKQMLPITIENATDHDIRLRSNTVVAHLQLVQSVLPMEVKEKTENEDAQPSSKDDVSQQTRTSCVSDIKLDGLSEEQESLAREMLLEESQSFSVNESDIGVAKENWKTAMRNAYDIVIKNSKSAAERNKKQYDKKIRSSTLEAGDRVLVRNLSERGGPGKLRAYWEDKIHIIVRRLSPDSPVYEVKPEKSDGRSRTLHRTLLLPCDYLGLDCETRDKISHAQKSPCLQHRMTDKQQHYSGEGTDSTEDEDNCPSFTPNEMPRLKTEFDRTTNDQQNALQFDMDPENDTALFEDNREADQPFQASSQSLDQSPSETDDRGSNSDTTVDSNEPEERPNPIHYQMRRIKSNGTQEDLHGQRHHHSRLVYNDFGKSNSEQQFYCEFVRCSTKERTPCGHSYPALHQSSYRVDT